MAGELKVARAQADEAQTLARLMQLYLHDFSALAPTESPYGELTADGLFAYPYLESYWTDPRREPLLVRVSGQLAGFVLINDWSASGKPVDFAIAEFFVARKYRRRGIGTEVVRQVIAVRPGQWEVAVLAANSPALAFWHSTLPAVHAGAIDIAEAHGRRWNGTIFRLTRS